MEKTEAIERLEYLKAKAQLALEQEVPEWIAEDVLGTIEAYDMAIEALQTEPKRGEWKPFDLTWGRSIWYCTACEESTEVPCDIWEHKPIYKYCPNCGADMRERECERCR